MDLFDTVMFEDEERARACIRVLNLHGGDNLLISVSDALSKTIDPSKSLIALTRFLDAADDHAVDIAAMADEPGFLQMLLDLFSQSSMMSDILCKNPEYGYWLWKDAPLERSRSRDEVLNILFDTFQNDNKFESRQEWLRCFSRRELLRIAAREVVFHASFDSIVSDISCLADAMLEGAYMASKEHLAERYGPIITDDAPQQEIEFCILAMGKLGGYELNFSSDIDLIFIYSANGHTSNDSPKQATSEEYYRKLCELIIKCMSENTRDGHVFRVDARLRPFGKSGPLACSLDNAVEYYSNYGRAWERQAMIKARPCAGNLALGNLFLEQLRPFIYPRYFDDTTLEEIRGVKQQTEAVTASKIHTDREVKLGRGGIRDIEFTVQMLQMLDGGRWPDSRTTNTLNALRALGNRQRIRPFDAETLERNYVFLRSIEHRLQIEGGRQTHILPEGEKELFSLARKLGYTDGKAFMSVYRERTHETRNILEQFLAAKGDGNLWVVELLEPESPCSSGLEKLRSLGFRDPEKARKELLLLANGPDDAPYTRDTAQQFSLVTPFILDALAKTPDPDTVLVRFSQVLSLLPVPATLYHLLKYHPDLSKYLIALISNSDYFGEMLVRDISLLDVLGTPGQIENPSRRRDLELLYNHLKSAANPAPALYRLRDGEVLKVALRDIVQGISVSAVGDELSQLAEIVIQGALDQARENTTLRYGTTTASFAVLALGKFGGRELGYGSDLDLVFVHEDEVKAQFDIKTSPTEYFLAIASQVLRQMKEPTRYGILYEVDARLRPDGNKGALAIPEQRFLQYYRDEAYFWERFALMKVRAVAGDPGFMAHIEAQARHIAFSVKPNRTALKELESMRAKLAASAPRFDLKRRQGGIAEIEFATRILQLHNVSQHPDLEGGGVFGALNLLLEKGLLLFETHASLHTGYNFYRRLLNRSRMMRGSSSSCINENPDNLKRLALSLGLDDDLFRLIEHHAERVHLAYTQIFDSVYDVSGE